MSTPAHIRVAQRVRGAIACLLFLCTTPLFAQDTELTPHWIELKAIRRALPVEAAAPTPTPAPAVVEKIVESPTAPPLKFTAPSTVYQVRPEARAIAKSFTQPVNFEYRLEALPIIVMQYTGETRMENIWAGTYFQGNLGFTNRVSFTAEVTRMVTAVFRLQTDSHVADSSQYDFANRMEGTLANKKFLGFTASTTGGLASITEASGAVIGQQYVRMDLVQDLPLLPVHLRVAPSLIAEHRIDTDRFLTGLESAILINVTQQTVLAVGAAQLSAIDALSGLTNSEFHTYYAQVDQRLSAETTVGVRVAYEEHIVNEVQNDAGMFLGVNSSFPLTETIRGGLQLRQRVAELISGAESLPETLLSFSLGGGF